MLSLCVRLWEVVINVNLDYIELNFVLLVKYMVNIEIYFMF